MRQIIELLVEEIPWYREHRWLVVGLLFSIIWLPMLAYVIYDTIRPLTYVEKSDYKSQQKNKIGNIVLKTIIKKYKKIPIFK